ncbi:MAG: fibronectin type III domain-containing protein [Blautia sp.]|nr:fibronectin type III domain-containing protein [Blautia sp.]
MKKIICALLTAILILQAGMGLVYADTANSVKQTESIEVLKIEIVAPGNLLIQGNRIALQNGQYSYKLLLRSTGELTFDNDLKIYYQGVDGIYRLHYEIDPTDQHIMIVTGTFNNLMAASPLLESIRSNISEDTYFYQLDLKTRNGFTFTNTLTFKFDGKKYGYTLNYAYDLLADKNTLLINGISGSGQISELADQVTAAIARKQSGGDSTAKAAQSTKTNVLKKASNSTITKVTGGTGSLTVNWTLSSGANGYRIQYCKNKTFLTGTKSVYVRSGSKGTVKIKNLQKNQRYYVRIRPYKIISGIEVYSSWSGIKSAKTK